MARFAFDNCNIISCDCDKCGYSRNVFYCVIGGQAMMKLLFSSGLRIKILEQFFFHPGQAFYVRSLAREIHENPPPVGRELTNLEKAGVLTSEMIGNQKHYSIDNHCPIIDELRTIFLKTSGVSAEIAKKLNEFSEVELVFIYGSYAKGDAKTTSDVDLMIVGNINSTQIALEISELEQELKREINYALYHRDEILDRIGKEGDFLHEVFSGDHIILIGSEDDQLWVQGIMLP